MQKINAYLNTAIAVLLLCNGAFLNAQVNKLPMQKTATILSIDKESMHKTAINPAPSVKSPGDVIFYDGFENYPVEYCPQGGWTFFPDTIGLAPWLVFDDTTGLGVNAHSGDKYAARINMLATDDGFWMFSPAINLTAGKTYSVSFWTMFGYAKGAGDSFEAYIGQSPTVDDMYYGMQIYYMYLGCIPSWTKITQFFTPWDSGDYYLGFHYFTPGGAGYMVGVDDVTVSEAYPNKLESSAHSYYTQIPTSQILPTIHAQVTNAGYNQQTAVSMKAVLNGTLIGASDVVMSLDPSNTADFSIFPENNVPSGNNTLTCTLNSYEGATDSYTLFFTGTTNIYAVDSVTSTSQGVGQNGNPITLGNIFEITTLTRLVQAVVGFSNPTPLDYSISLYEMTGDMTLSSTPLFTQSATRNATGFTTVTVPEITLLPGKYFLCVNQLDQHNIAVRFDANPAHPSYQKFQFDNSLIPMPASLNGLAIRMILGDLPANDAFLKTITEPVVPLTGVCNNLTSAERVTATIQNYGSAPITSAQMKLTVDNGTPVTETYTGNIATGAMDSYTFNAKANLSAAGDHTIKVEIVLAGDENTDNNSKTITLHNVICNAATLPLTEDFESDTYWCWTMISNNDIDGPGGPGDQPMGVYYYDDTHSNEFSFSSRDWQYISDFNQYLISPELPNNGGLKITFDYRDPVDDGDAFKVGYSTTTDDVADFTWGDEYTTNTAERTKFFGIFPAETKYIAINYYGQWGGMTVDNIVIDELPAHDATITAITAPVSGVNLTNAETVTATIANYGIEPITTAQMKLTVDDGTPVTETYTGNIITGDTDSYTFTAKADLSAAGEHKIKVEVVLAGDADNSNDIDTITVKNVVCGTATLPLTEDFESDSYWCWTMSSNNPENAPGGSEMPMGVYYNGYDNNSAFFFSSFNYAENGDYNQYLISPELPTTNKMLNFSFDYWSPSNDSELFKVGYSTTTNDVSAFTWGDENTSESVDVTRFSSNVPAGTKYVAVNYYTYYMYELAIDNIEINTSTAVPSVNSNGINIYQNNGQLFIQVSSDASLHLFDIFGRVLGNYQANANSTLIISEPSGVYLLEFITNGGVSTYKVLVK